jgi:hypothetical protein
MRAAALWTGGLRGPCDELFGLLSALLAGVFVKGHFVPRIFTNGRWGDAGSHSS